MLQTVTTERPLVHAPAWQLLRDTVPASPPPSKTAHNLRRRTVSSVRHKLLR